MLAEVTVPVRLTTACTFGGDDLCDLYVTTSRENLDDPEPRPVPSSARASPCRAAGARLRRLSRAGRLTATDGVCRVPGPRSHWVRDPSVGGGAERGDGAAGPRPPAGRHTRVVPVGTVAPVEPDAEQAPGQRLRVRQELVQGVAEVVVRGGSSATAAARTARRTSSLAKDAVVPSARAAAAEIASGPKRCPP